MSDTKITLDSIFFYNSFLLLNEEKKLFFFCVTGYFDSDCVRCAVEQSRR